MQSIIFASLQPSRRNRPSIRHSRRRRIPTASPVTAGVAAQQPQPGSTPSFSLTEGGMDEEEGEDAEAN